MIRKSITRREAAREASLPGTMHPVLRRVLAARDISQPGELDYSLAHLLPGDLLLNSGAAADLLVAALEGNRRIVIVADYDADGATACALGVRGLSLMGARDVHFIVPDRFLHGYGLSPEIVELAAELQPDLLITVDNGISSIAGVRAARSRGIDVLITDHHIPGAELPDANVIVNPNLPGDPFPSKSLAGVGVMFYVLASLRMALRKTGWFETRAIAEPKLAQFLDLVALGTVADVVRLDYNNRILVAQGLQRIRAGRCVAGIRALLVTANKTADSITSSDLGFSIGPRLNAAGRLTDMRLGIQCLLSDNDRDALDMASRLDQLNRERREIQSGMEKEADEAVADMQLGNTDDLPHGICLYQPHWHQGVVGILASRVKEKTRRPVIAFARESEHSLKGSARSISGIHIRDVLDVIASLNPGLITRFGGHAMAAGLSLELEHYEQFTDLFDREIRQHIAAQGFDSELVSDGELAAGDFSLALASEMREAGPWGQGFPEPRFDGVFSIVDARIVGERHLKLQLGVDEMEKPVEAIAFNTTDESWPGGYAKVEALYRLDINEFRGRRTLQLVIEHIEPVPA